MKTDLETQPRQDFEASLRTKIAFWIAEGISNGISAKPHVTYAIAFEEEPELAAAVGRQRVWQLCRERHAFEDLDQSIEYEALFDEFNDKYFHRRLPKYRVRVIADLFYWITTQDDLLLNLIELGGESVNLVDPFDPYYYSADGFEPSRIDLLGRQIVLSTHQDGRHTKESQLIHHMAHAATGSISDRDVHWHPEMKRLRHLGAPVGDGYLEFRLRTGEYVG